MKICIFGLGRIGLPLGLVSADSGYEVVGVDKDSNLINNLENGVLPFHEPFLGDLLQKCLRKSFYLKHYDPQMIEEDLKQCRVIILAIGVKFTGGSNELSLSDLYGLVNDLINIGLRGKSIISRTTAPIGTTDRIKDEIESNTDLRESEDFYLSFVPERLMEGCAVEEERTLPKIIGSYSEEGFLQAKAFFERIGGKIIRVSNPKMAELIKLLDNAWRDTRFAFANELAFLASSTGIDIHEAINAANDGYPRNKIPVPGPVGGYCLSKDPYILEYSFREISRKRGFNSVWYYGRKANEWLCNYVIEHIQGENILIAGLSFKENIDDYRDSLAIKIAGQLVDRGYNVKLTDPFLDNNSYTVLPDELEKRVEKCNSIKEGINQTDTIIFATKHTEYTQLDLPTILKDNKKPSIKVIDLWNIYGGRLEGFDFINYVGFGRGG